MDIDPKSQDGMVNNDQADRSGGVDVSARQVSVAKDVVGRDKNVQNIFKIKIPKVGIAILFLVVVAITAIAVVLIQKNSGSGDTFYVAGTQFNGNVVFNTVTIVTKQAEQVSGKELPDNVVEVLNQAMAFVASREFEKAIPLLESVANTAPSPALYNNLGGAYLAIGDWEKATSYFEKALASNPDEASARSNLNLLQTVPVTRVSLDTPGVSAELIDVTRFQNTLTIKLRFRNSSEKDLSLFLTASSHLLDEATHKTYGVVERSTLTTENIPASGSLEVWVKYNLPADQKPQYLTLVLGGGILFEHVNVP